MALITTIEKLSMDVNKVHELADCTYSVFEQDGKKYIQIDTYGSAKRKFKGKKSQTIQFDAQGAKQLKRLIAEHF